MTLLSTQEQFGKQRFSLDNPTIQSGLGIIYIGKKYLQYFKNNVQVLSKLVPWIPQIKDGVSCQP
jgi:hypothetical protein